MNFKRLLYTDFGKIIISILLGLGLASLFRRSCADRKCLKFIGPPIQEVNGQIYEFDKQCYMFKPKASKCNSKMKQVTFA